MLTMPENKFMKIMSYSEKVVDVVGPSEFSRIEIDVYKSIKTYFTNVMGLSSEEFKYLKGIMRLSLGDRGAFSKVLKLQDISSSHILIYESMFADDFEETQLFRSKLEDTFPKALMKDICKIVDGSEFHFVRFA
jgi:hypothetical protein